MDHEIGRKVIGAVMEQLFAADIAGIGDFQEAREQAALAAMRTLAAKSSPHGLR